LGFGTLLALCVVVQLFLVENMAFCLAFCLFNVKGKLNRSFCLFDGVFVFFKEVSSPLVCVPRVLDLLEPQSDPSLR
jgi:hypothetical protein